ncbi:sodium:solute symporter family protein [Paraburkholderia tagetis]|uniref:Sodium:solute symporter family protein n=1 Tax=Paraburkholderia tagetis TaxID=2913261 RepID=A0A9X1UIU3_9BURK|nr:sodium:solute symporter family protein [Paraburkholderia tagetis]MCG5075457.1 sodium:solute symporter family protein [Paraburkholderia tagetis]
MSTLVFSLLIALSLYLAIRSRRGHSKQSVHDFFVASGQFGTAFVFFLTAGEIYSIGTMVGFPGGIYAKGPTYGVWFLGYILLAYPVGYFIGPRIWEAGRRHNAITQADLFKGHYRSRALELIVAGSAILFLIPWGQLQFTGLVAALKGLGWHVQPIWLIVVCAVLAFTYIAISGVRASAWISVLKDTLMLVAIVITGVAAVSMAGGTHEVFHAASKHVSNTMTAPQLRFSMSTMLFQSLGFYMMPFGVQGFFTARGPNTIRRTQIVMPLYMVMYPFLVMAAYYAISANLKLASPNDAFFAAAVHLLPDWLLGLVAAGAALSGLLVLAGICLAIGPIVTRNLLPNLPESRQKRTAKFVIVAYLLVSILTTLFTPNLMLALINTTLYGVTQFLPGMLILLAQRRVRPGAVAAGILCGQGLAIVCYALHIDFGGVNLGLVCLGVNVLVVFVVHILMRPSGRRYAMPDPVHHS